MKKKMLFMSMFLMVFGVFFLAKEASAVTAFSYNGTGIRSWDSKGQAHIAAGKKVTVTHTQNKWSTNVSAAKTMNVTLRRKNVIGYSNVGSASFSNDTNKSNKQLTSKLGTAGTHYLRFENTKPAGWTAAATANISGSVNY